jgi:hypothetical protein
MNDLKRRGLILSVVIVSLGAGAGAWVVRSDDDPQERVGGRDDIPLREFMRQKLDASNQILEGLVMDDPALIKEGADVLNQMSTAERWRVQNDALYRNFSVDFQRITSSLAEAADEGDTDRAALNWMDATMSCIECHRYVRGMRVVDSDAEGS